MTTAPVPAPENVMEDLCLRLDALGLGVFLTDIFPGVRPAAPDTVLVLTKYGGDAPRLLDGDNVPHDERLAVQVLARARSPHDADRLARSAYYALPFRHETLASGREYAWCRAEGYPALIGRDENDRALVAFDVTLRRHYP